MSRGLRSRPGRSHRTLAFGSLTRWVRVGERFHIEDELVQKYPQHFAKLTPLTD